jgi:hypothetical protein
MDLPANPGPTEYHDAEESRFEEESGQHFEGEKRRKDIRHGLRKTRKVGPELEFEDNARDCPDGKIDGEDLDPETIHPVVDLLLRPKPQEFDDDEIKREANRQGGK